MIEGARRIGKSYIAEEFARNEYDSYILIDFSKAPAQTKSRTEAEEAALAYYSGKMVADDIHFIDSAAPLPKELLSSSYPELPSQEEIKNDPRYAAAIGHKE